MTEAYALWIQRGHLLMRRSSLISLSASSRTIFLKFNAIVHTSPDQTEQRGDTRRRRTGYHFARPGNRFWPTLYRAGFMDRLLSPFEGRAMVQLGYGLTNLVERATARADELSIDELKEGARRLEEKVRRYRPRYVAMLGISAYRVAFTTPKATLGRREETLGPAMLWVLPSPSVLNAHYQLDGLTRAYAELSGGTQSCGSRR